MSHRVDGDGDTLRRWGVVVISHGSGEASWIARVDEAVGVVQAQVNIPVIAGFLEGVAGRSIPDAVGSLESQGVSDLVIIPLFISTGSTHVAEIKMAFGLLDVGGTDLPVPEDCGIPRVQSNMRMHWRAPLDAHPLVVQMLRELADRMSTCKQEEALLLVAHGSSYPAYAQRWRDGLSHMAHALYREGYAAVEGALLLPDDTQEKITRLTELQPTARLLVVPLFLSEGYFTRKVVPRRLLDYEYHYEGRALLPHPLVSEWIVQEIGDAIATKVDQRSTR